MEGRKTLTREEEELDGVRQNTSYQTTMTSWSFREIRFSPRSTSNFILILFLPNYNCNKVWKDGEEEGKEVRKIRRRRNEKKVSINKTKHHHSRRWLLQLLWSFVLSNNNILHVFSINNLNMKRTLPLVKSSDVTGHRLKLLLLLWITFENSSTSQLHFIVLLKYVLN